MEKKAILVTGASSDVGLKIIEAIESEYDVIYAHYGRTDIVLKKIKEQFGTKIVLIKDDFSKEESGKEIIDTIADYGVWPRECKLFCVNPLN